MTGAERACEMLKTLRGAWMTKRQIAKHLELRPDTVAEWVDEWQRQGFLDVRLGDKPARGPAPVDYTLSPCWIGGAR